MPEFGSFLARIDAAQAAFLQGRQYAGQQIRKQDARIKRLKFKLQEIADKRSVGRRRREDELVVWNPDDEDLNSDESSDVEEESDAGDSGAIVRVEQLHGLRMEAGFAINKHTFPPTTLGRGRLLLGMNGTMFCMTCMCGLLQVCSELCRHL